MRRRLVQWLTIRMLAEAETGRRHFEAGNWVAAGSHMQAAAWLGIAAVAVAPRRPVGGGGR